MMKAFLRSNAVVKILVRLDTLIARTTAIICLIVGQTAGFNMSVGNESAAVAFPSIWQHFGVRRLGDSSLG
jgi:hypothetical protein